MNFIIIIVESIVTKRSYDDLGGKVVSELGGDDCHSLSNAWILRTTADAAAVHKLIIEQKLIHAADRFIVATLRGKWLSCNAPSADDCFQG